MKANRRYDPEFKREAVRLVVEDGLGVREVERNLGITYGVLKGWVQKHRDHQDAGVKTNRSSICRLARSAETATISASSR